jgi:hypothetical protein
MQGRSALESPDSSEWSDSLSESENEFENTDSVALIERAEPTGLNTENHDQGDTQGEDTTTRRVTFAENDTSTRSQRTSSHSRPYRQRYDRRGHPVNPESEANARSRDRAINEILADLGVIDRTRRGASRSQSDAAIASQARERKKREEIIMATRENEMGFVIRFVDMALFNVAIWPVYVLRNRLQVFPVYSQISLSGGFNLLCKHFGVAQVLLAGFPAFLTYLSLNLAREYLQAYLDSRLRARLFKKGQDGRRYSTLQTRALLRLFNTTYDILFTAFHGYY